MSKSPPYSARALYDYSSPHEDDLNFGTGQKIKVTAAEDDDWLQGEYHDKQGNLQQGIFPKNYVEVVEDEPETPKLPPVPSRPVHDELKKETPASKPAADIQHLERSQTITSPVVEEASKSEPEPSKDTSKRKSVVPIQPAKIQPPPPAPPAAPFATKPTSPLTEEGVSDNQVGSFRDRIAAFNKAKAAPIAPVQGQPRSSGFIKKPFVAPPPSKTAYVPPPQPLAESRRETERAPLPREPPPNKQVEGEREEPPKVSSLKDRIALLQSVQLNPVMGGKPKKPPKPPPPAKKREEGSAQISTQSSEPVQTATEGEKGDELSQEKERTVEAKAAPSIPIIPSHVETHHDEEAEVLEPEQAKLNESESDDEPETIQEARPSTSSLEPTPEVSAEPKEEVAEEAAEEDEDVDPEVARRLAIRERMMKMSGGMGMFGLMAPGPKPLPKPARNEVSGENQEHAEMSLQEPIRMVPILPMARPPPQVPVEAERDGLSGQRRESDDEDSPVKDAPTDDEDTSTETLDRRNLPMAVESEADEPIPRSLPTSRPPPPVPSNHPTLELVTQVVNNTTEGSESDDEMSYDEKKEATTSPVFSSQPKMPERPTIAAPRRPEGLDTTAAKRISYLGSPPPVPDSPLTPISAKRASFISRGGQMPPIPSIAGNAPTGAPLARPPPPPPPTLPPVRRPTDEAKPPPVAIDDSDEEESTEYEGDVDTELEDSRYTGKSTSGHVNRDEDYDEHDETPLPSPTKASIVPPPRLAPNLPPPPPPAPMPSSAPPPLPPAAPPKLPQDIPSPPPPSNIPPPSLSKRDSTERARPLSYIKSPYSYPNNSTDTRFDEEDEYGTVAEAPHPARSEKCLAPESSHPRRSEDRPRVSVSGSRRSFDVSRSGTDLGHTAKDEDLGLSTQWWIQENTPPPVFQNRSKDIYFEVEDATSSKRGGRTSVTRDVYILFPDYSQTIITATFERDDPASANVEQRHEPPPQPLRQDKLEAASAEFGKAIVDAAESHVNKVVGDGQPSALPAEFIKSLPGVLAPVGTRSYGIPVYQNLGNATIQQLDEIRPGDIMTFRHAKFQGHKGGLHHKYALDISKTDHVGVVYDWDGTKKKVRIFEQGRESKKVKLESFRVGDLRSGEVKIWRVVGKSWVNW